MTVDRLALIESELADYRDEIYAIDKREKARMKARDRDQKRSREQMIEAGKRLTEAKELIDHGAWLPWLKKMGIAARTAQDWMKYAAAYLPNKTGTTEQSPPEKPEKPDEPPVIPTLHIIGDAQITLGRLQTMREKARTFSAELDQIKINAIVASFLSIAEVARETADIVRNYSNKKRDHLALIEKDKVA